MPEQKPTVSDWLRSIHKTIDALNVKVRQNTEYVMGLQILIERGIGILWILSGAILLMLILIFAVIVWKIVL